MKTLRPSKSTLGASSWITSLKLSRWTSCFLLGTKQQRICSKTRRKLSNKRQTNSRVLRSIHTLSSNGKDPCIQNKRWSLSFLISTIKHNKVQQETHHPQIMTYSILRSTKQIRIQIKLNFRSIKSNRQTQM